MGKHSMFTRCLQLILALTFSLILPSKAGAFSVLTHEALIDANWERVILPLLKEKYGTASDEDLRAAKAYCYGGAVSPDMGYYPFGSKFFTNLVHYVRSGDFVLALLHDERNLNEYAFALGALSHYMADRYGHPLGINVSVPVIYPELGKKFGSSVTYAEDKTSHLRTEFGFDVLQTARGNYASESYHNFIGFSVADTLLSRAFFETYGLKMNEVFSNFKRSEGTFRWTVKNFFPVLTRAAWVSKKAEIRKTRPGLTGRQFSYRMKRSAYKREFGNEREKPGVRAFLLGALIKILPKVGPLKALKFKTPGPEAEKHFIGSFDTVLTRYGQYIHPGASRPRSLPDIDFDTGEATSQGEYPLCDETYLELLTRLDKEDFQNADAALKSNIRRFYRTIPEEKKDVIAPALQKMEGKEVIK